MCIVYMRPVQPDAPLPRLAPEHIYEGARRNPDGFGLMWADAGVLNVRKYMPADHKRFAQDVLDLDAQHVTYVAHARIRTHGPVNLDLAHPFTYEQPDGVIVGIAHNGVIDIATKADESDTQVFVRDVLARLPAYWWRDGALRYLVGEAIGWSKLAVLTSTGEADIINEDAGTWDGGIWRSNATYKPLPAYTYTSKWTPKAQTAASNPTPSATTPKGKAKPTPEERKAQNAARRAARREARKARKGAPNLRVVDAPRSLSHGGHALTTVRDFDAEADATYMDAVRCVVCGTLGDVYAVPDYGLFIDIEHRTGDAHRDYTPIPAAALADPSMPF